MNGFKMLQGNFMTRVTDRLVSKLTWNTDLMTTDGVYLVGDYSLNEVISLNVSFTDNERTIAESLESRCSKSFRGSEFASISNSLRSLRLEAKDKAEQSLTSSDFLLVAMQLSENLINRGFGASVESHANPTGCETTPPLYWMTKERDLLVALPPIGTVPQAVAMEARRQRQFQDESPDNGKDAFLASFNEPAPGPSLHFEDHPTTRLLSDGPNGPGLWMRMGKYLIPGAVSWQDQTFYAHDLLYFEILQDSLEIA